MSEAPNVIDNLEPLGEAEAVGSVKLVIGCVLAKAGETRQHENLLSRRQRLQDRSNADVGDEEATSLKHLEIFIMHHHARPLRMLWLVVTTADLNIAIYLRMCGRPLVNASDEAIEWQH